MAEVGAPFPIPMPELVTVIESVERLSVPLNEGVAAVSRVVA